MSSLEYVDGVFIINNPPMSLDLLEKLDDKGYTFGETLNLSRGHNPNNCVGRPCSLHSPTNHALRNNPMGFWSSTGLLVRLCDHDNVVLDPDVVDFAREGYPLEETCCGWVLEGSKRVRCNQCGDVIRSQSRHDFVSCSCGLTSVDGGYNYLRVLGSDWTMEGEKDDTEDQ